MGVRVTGIKCGSCGVVTQDWQSSEGMDGVNWELWKCISCGNEVTIRTEWSEVDK